MTQHTLSASLLLASLGALAACSGSDGPTGPAPVAGISGPQGVSLVDPDPSNVSTGTSGTPNAGGSFPANSAYVTDAASIGLYENSLDAIGDANNILCELGLTRFWRFVNNGAYTAQVDPALCGNGPDANEGDGQAVSLHVFTMNSTRASASDPQNVSLWLPLLEGGQPISINGEIVVEEGPSVGDPYGAFTFTYSGFPDGGSAADPVIYAVMQSNAGERGFRFLSGEGDVTVPAANPGDEAELLQVAVERNGNGTGAAKITRTIRFNNGGGDSGPQTTTWRVVYDATHVKKQLDANPEVVLARTNFKDNVYAYNTYYNDGANQGDRVALNSGLGVEFPNGNYGWVGYFGAWAEFPETFTNGGMVTSTADDTPYTVVKAPGRLMKYTEAELALASLGTQRFEWHSGADRFQIAYSGVEWQRVAIWNGMNEEWDPVVPATMINVSTEGGYLNLYSQFLGPVTYVDTETSITYFERELVNGSSDLFAVSNTVDLRATYEGLKGEISQTEIDNGDVYLATPANISSAHKFVIDGADMTLYHDVNGDGSNLEQVGLAAGITPTGGPNEWGMRSGRMVISTAWAGMSTIDDVFSESEFFVYETGHNEWNQLVGLTDATDEWVTFDRPLEFLYTHSTAQDINGDPTYNGQQVLLQYNGPGRLWGIPGEEIDADGDGQIDRYFPNFSIADGTVVGSMGEFIVRAIGVDQTLTVDPGAGATLNLADADALTVPDPALYVTPEIGAEPTVTSPPAVIDGVIQ